VARCAPDEGNRLFTKGIENTFQHLCLVLIDLPCPKPNYSKTSCLQKLFPPLICFAHVLVVSSIDLDNKPLFVTAEIGNVPSDWKLASEFVPVELPIAENPPELSFHGALFPTEFPCRRDAIGTSQTIGHSWRHWSPSSGAQRATFSPNDGRGLLRSTGLRFVCYGSPDSDFFFRLSIQS
jgi:hypothetical protein